MKAFAVLISGLLLASPAFAQPTPGPSEAGATTGLSEQGGGAATDNGNPGATPSDADRPICRRVIADPSSRMGNRRVCMTAAQWRESQRAH